jgi:hypothetical protein
MEFVVMYSLSEGIDRSRVHETYPTMRLTLKRSTAAGSSHWAHSTQRIRPVRHLARGC